jgi:hypothetical protein
MIRHLASACAVFGFLLAGCGGSSPPVASRSSRPCQEAPWDTTVKRFTVPSGQQPFATNVPIDRNYPWGVQLTDGERCLAIQGTHDAADGSVVDYACQSTYTHVLLRPIHWNGQQATFDSAYYNATTGNYSPGPTVSIATAWYAIPDTQPTSASAGNCSLPGGAEGGFALPFSATGIGCSAAIAVVKDVAYSGGPCTGANLTGAGCHAALGFVCRISAPSDPGHASPGDIAVCVDGTERITLDLPG